MWRHGVRRTNEVRSVRVPDLLNQATFLSMSHDPRSGDQQYLDYLGRTVRW